MACAKRQTIRVLYEKPRANPRFAPQRRSKLDSDDELKAIISDQIKQMMKSRRIILLKSWIAKSSYILTAMNQAAYTAEIVN